MNKEVYNGDECFSHGAHQSGQARPPTEGQSLREHHFIQHPSEGSSGATWRQEGEHPGRGTQPHVHKRHPTQQA